MDDLILRSHVIYIRTGGVGDVLCFICNFFKINLLFVFPLFTDFLIYLLRVRPINNLFYMCKRL